MKVLNDLLGYQNTKIYQDTEMFSFTLDSILVARFMNLNSKIKTIVDFGTNNAVIPIILSKYTKAKIFGVEIQTKAVQIAIENIELNNLINKVDIIHADIKEFAKTANHKYDAVICNPPFFKMDGEPKLREVSVEMANARHETLITLEQIIESAAKTVRNGGSITLVHRAERVGEIITLFSKNAIICKRIRFIHSKINRESKTVLIDGILQGNVGVQILPPLITHNNDETYTKELLDMFEE